MINFRWWKTAIFLAWSRFRLPVTFVMALLCAFNSAEAEGSCCWCKRNYYELQSLKPVLVGSINWLKESGGDCAKFDRRWLPSDSPGHHFSLLAACADITGKTQGDACTFTSGQAITLSDQEILAPWQDPQAPYPEYFLPLCDTMDLSDDHCLFYRCLDDRLGCQGKGYAIDYGLRYCFAFLQGCDSSPGSPSYDQWQKATRVCLQKSLAQSEATLSNMTCAGAEDVAFSSHAYCYTDGAKAEGGPSICELMPADWVKILRCIGWEDRLSKRFLVQARAVMDRCLAKSSGEETATWER